MHQVFEENKQGYLLRVRLTPNSANCRKNGFFTTPDGEEYIKINVISVPEKGKANKELIAYLAKTLKLAKADMEIISGELDRYKKVQIKTKEKITIEQLAQWSEEI